MQIGPRLVSGHEISSVHIMHGGTLEPGKITAPEGNTNGDFIICFLWIGWRIGWSISLEKRSFHE